MSEINNLIYYEKWNSEKTKYMSEYDKQIADLKKLLTNNFTIKQAEALEKILNNIIKQITYNDDNNIIQSIFNLLDTNIDEATKKGLQIGANFKITSQESETAWAKYNAAADKYRKKGMKKEDIDKLDEIEPLLKNAQSLSGALNKLQGDIFEGFLHILSLSIQDTVNDFVEEKINDMEDKVLTNYINNISKSIANNFEIKIKELEQKNEKIKTLGSETRELEAELGDEIWTISSQGKTDVQLKSPFIKSEELNVSAKNYSKISDISLLSSGSIIGLVSQWDVKKKARDIFYNGLTVWQTPYDLLQKGEVIMSVQALVGTGIKKNSQEILSNCLIINISSASIKSRIRVIPFPPLINYIIDNQNNINKYFITKYQPQLQLFKHGEIRHEQDFQERIKSLKVGIELKSAALYATAASRFYYSSET